jgi:hypothetical protein
VTSSAPAAKVLGASAIGSGGSSPRSRRRPAARLNATDPSANGRPRPVQGSHPASTAGQSLGQWTRNPTYVLMLPV